MSLKYLCNIIIVFFVNEVYCQETQILDSAKWVCTYKYEFLQDSTSRNSLKQVQMVLQVGNRLSKFCDLSSFISDSIIYSVNKSKFNEANSQLILDQLMKSTSGIGSNFLADYILYKNCPGKGESFMRGYEDHKFYKVIQPLKMSWRLVTSADTLISSYVCKKATTTFAGRKYVAWYSMQIPISDGPYKFNGLPGLIVKINDTENEHRFTLNSVRKLNYIRPITHSIQNYVEISAPEYVQILRTKMARLILQVQNGNINIISDEAKSRSLQGLKTRNNFIEKYK